MTREKWSEATCDALCAAEDLIEPAIKSAHVGLVPWCRCCEAMVQIDHICECKNPDHRHSVEYYDGGERK